MKLGDKLEGHFCLYCLPQVDEALRSKDNPAKTAQCLRCGHFGEGINSTGQVGNWLNIGKTTGDL